MINVTYRFYLSTSETFSTSTARRVAPIYGDDLAIEWAKESGEQFYRAKLSGNLSFVGADYDWIMSQAFDTVIYVTIRQSSNSPVENLKTWATLWSGSFMRTDATIDTDNKIFTVQPVVVDEYEDVIAGLDKEYNLVTLAPVVQPVTIQKRPLIQVYIPGDNIVSCFLSQMYWEQDVTKAVTDENALTSTYHFSRASRFAEIMVTAQGGASTALSGLYVGSITAGASGSGVLEQGTFRKSGTNYNIQYIRQTTNAEITEVYYFYNGSALLYSYVGSDSISNKQITLNPSTGLTGSLLLDINVVGVYMRYLVNVTMINDVECFPIPSNDIVENNRNYKYCCGYDVDLAVISDNLSDEPTEWGMNDSGKYFLPPGTGVGYYPIGRSLWQNASLWFHFYALDWVLEEKARAPFVLRDNYELASVINVLLQEFAPGITHEATTAYSQFLYSSTNPISGHSFSLSITPKTNIINGEYQDPTNKAVITLRNIMDALANMYKCYWFVDGGKFRIEQIQWFRNGGSYTGSPVVGFDLTKMTNVRNGKAWDYQMAKYSFDKIEMPERYQFSWSDDSTDLFDGNPIDIVSNYVEKGNIEEIQVTKFTSDVDLMLLNPSAISEDGFAIFAAIDDGAGGWKLPFVNFIDNDNVSHIMQNGLLAFAMLQENYWRYDMPARYMKINGVQMSALSIQRGKEQEVVVPVESNIPDPMKIVKTSLGNGQIESFSLNLSSRMAEAKLRYDTE